MIDLSNRFSEAYAVLGYDTIAKYTLDAAKILGAQSEVKLCLEDLDIDSGIEVVIDEFAAASGHSVTNLLRYINLADDLTYKDVLWDAAEHLDLPKSRSIEKLEDDITWRFFEEIFEDLPEEQRRKVLAGMVLEYNRRNEKKIDLSQALKSGLPFAAIFAGQSAGFSLYLAATTSLHAIASAIGLTLGFGTYTALAGAISAALGPIGIATAAAFAAYNFGQPSYKRKVIPCILLFAALRGESDMAFKRPKNAKKSAHNIANKTRKTKKGSSISKKASSKRKKPAKAVKKNRKIPKRTPKK